MGCLHSSLDQFEVNWREASQLCCMKCLILKEHVFQKCRFNWLFALFWTTYIFLICSLYFQSEVSRREGCKYVMVWLLMLWVMIFARFWGMARRLNSTNVPLDPIHEAFRA